MAEYQVIARKYRPGTFTEILGQEAIVVTLKNAIRNRRLAHAYLFCGSRGTGKTTLARVLAKALNCLNPSEDLEPCNQCSFCKDISGGHSLDVLEIDGASHRGIDDIRQINENVGYATSSGKFKIYIIDEVHMLTKEAFNALLKTLEEPPPKVVFIFATTEPHKVLPTILSRCQRFNLNRIPVEQIVNKLKRIAEETGIDIEEKAIRLIANRADGGLSDAESLFDQIIAFREGRITLEDVASILGVMSRDHYFEIDKAGKEGRLSVAFDIADRVFSEGKDLIYFVEGLTEHFRNILHIKLAGRDAPHLSATEEEREKYFFSASLYSQEQCLTILDHLIQALDRIRFSPSGRFALESILLFVLRVHQRIPIDVIVHKLAEIENRLQENPQPKVAAMTPEATVAPEPAPPKMIQPERQPVTPSIQEDPDPKPSDIVSKPKSKQPQPPAPIPAIPPQKKIEEPVAPVDMSKQCHYDTIMQFAAVELEGKLEKKLSQK